MEQSHCKVNRGIVDGRLSVNLFTGIKQQARCHAY